MHTRGIWAAFLAIALVVCSLALPAQAAERRWETDGALTVKVVTQVRAAGIGAVKPHVKAMESALKAARALFAKPIIDAGTTVVLTDGKIETAAALVAAASGKSGDVVAMANPYPTLGILLGSYYVETGKFRDAVRVLDAALALSPLPKQRLGQTVPDLLNERGIAFGRLNQWKEALATYDTALKIKQMDNTIRAMLHRGRGFTLIEMGRLDEAEAAYKKSLTLDRGNKIALNELKYIEGLRAGRQPTGSTLLVPGAAN